MKNVFKKEDLINTMAEEQNISKAEANRIIDAYHAGVQAQLEKMKPEDKLQLVGKLTYEVVNKPAHTAKNPRTKADVKVAEKNTVRIKAGSEFLEAVAL
jgi:DNA-binding protein HU-beta